MRKKGDEVTINIRLAGPWNMVSIPIVPKDNSIESVFPDSCGVYAYDPAKGGYIVPNIIEPCVGYWVCYLEPRTIKITGSPVTKGFFDLEEKVPRVVATLVPEPDFIPPEDVGLRKLVAVMFADVVASTRLMEKDEESTIKTIKEQQTIMNTLIKLYKGRFIKHIGDAIMADFTSSVNAVRCAIQIQKKIQKRNKGKPYTKKMLVRIGVHSGDVHLEENEDIRGHAVDIASRIESMAEAGGICVSRDVFNQIKSMPDIRTARLGSKKLKNIEQPIEIYKVLIDDNT